LLLTAIERKSDIQSLAHANFPLGILNANVMSQSRLFVGNLSYQTGETDLQDHFAQVGAVTSVNLMMDKMTGKSRGFAFVEFASAEEAQKAIDQFHNQDFQGRAITVNVARPREERPPRNDRFSGGGGGGGGGGRGYDRGDRSGGGERRERY
jgi:cold-inducible RNA-binding protein